MADKSICFSFIIYYNINMTRKINLNWNSKRKRKTFQETAMSNVGRWTVTESVNTPETTSATTSNPYSVSTAYSGGISPIHNSNNSSAYSNGFAAGSCVNSAWGNSGSAATWVNNDTIETDDSEWVEDVEEYIEEKLTVEKLENQLKKILLMMNGR